MSVNKLFTLDMPPKIENIFCPLLYRNLTAVVTGFDVYLSDQEPRGVEAMASIPEHGHFIYALKKYREATIEEVKLNPALDWYALVPTELL